MSPKIVNFEIILIYFLLLIPWPHTQVIKLLCSRDNSRLVRKIVRSKWTPILDKYQVKLPLECPLHPFRDVFAPRQDAKKRDRPTQWTCRKCGKSFYQEKFLDLHFETRHRSIVNRDEDAVCLADFCDIMRCEVFQSEESTRLNTGDSHIITDIEVWGDSLGQNSALAKANAAYLSLIPLRTSAIGASRAAKVQQGRQLCQDKVGQTKFKDSPKDPHHVEKADHAERPKSTNDSSKKRAGSGSSPSGFSAATGSRSQGAKTDPKKGSAKKLPASNRSDQEEEEEEEQEDSVDGESGNGDEGANNGNTSSNGNRTQNGNGQNMQKVRANCRAEELSKLKAKCEYLVRNCIAGLLLSMTDHAFKEMEEEMNKAVCWYLSCDRYWEDGPLEPRAFPWGLIVILIFVLSTGICFCYYIIWILFDSEESTINANHQPYLHHQQPHGGGMGGGHGTGAYPQHYYYQQQQQPEDLYPELPRYDYRHSPRRYNERTQQQQQQQQHQPQHQSQHHQQQHQPQHQSQQHQHQHQQHQQQPQQHGTPTTTGSGHGAQSAAYQQDIFDRRDYTNRTTIPTTAVTGGGGVGSTSASGPPTTGMGNAKASGSHMNLADVVSEANAVNLATMIGGGGIGGIDGQRHYTPNQSSSSLHHHHHQLEPHHRHTGASQTSLRGSASSHEIIQSDVGHNEHYIYVTYPPDLKKRYFDKYE